MSSFSIRERIAKLTKETVSSLESQKVACEKALNICKKALEESLEPRDVWLQNKKELEKRCEEIDGQLKRARVRV